MYWKCIGLSQNELYIITHLNSPVYKITIFTSTLPFTIPYLTLCCLFSKVLGRLYMGYTHTKPGLTLRLAN